MDTDKLAIKDDQPLANSATNAKGARSENRDEGVVTIFDVTNKIEWALKQLETKVEENEKQFERSLNALEDQISRWNERD
ncbi:hypothetical protein HG536_0H01190 [Torulaspora globosa]|uniref:Uncharacterized protein n=1 Tax=Torulaspora globosa TaxID=48254 RepID=A0A7G3ZMK8_9SACH|nr:uncharacterized protein HG536_0H01190 [Torulaspora globosa]QLL34744.1 hypothetical protein HG536_0H01190 [Torulaspora globosa]